ncbi:hypothetical protein MAM1_0289d09294 [Mucor ambiguus]|uniref:Uncharacterized protein n=1 Tax=Mucor ambiguus TaxID=91626 RepID=A0A0C9N1E8_9FUNG|nr:hypothetical protein MAM1_0289d09294 [Mucor ambiguus]
MSMNDLFYVLQETDLNNQELYFPPDTPFGKTNPRRLKLLLKKHHARQQERLLNQQVAELDEYQKKFAIENKEDLFIRQTRTACELMSGPDFLIECNDQIMELLSMIPLMNNTAGKNTEMSELTDSVVPEEKSLAPPPPSLPSDDEVDTSENEEDSLTDMPQEVGGGGAGHDDDGAIHQRKIKYSTIIKKKYRKGFARIRRLHEAQLKKLKDLQKEDLDAIIEEPAPPPPPMPVEETETEINSSLARNYKEQSPRPNGKDRQKQLERGRAANERQREAWITAQQSAQQSIKTMRHSIEQSHINKDRQNTNGNMSWNQPKSHTIPNISTSLKPSTEVSPWLPIAPSPRPPMVVTSRPPSVATAGPPSNTTACPPVVAFNHRKNKNYNNHDNHDNHDNRRGKLYRGRRDSNQPLFDTNPIKFKPSTLLDENSGSIYIKNKPDRVIINGQDFGSPKDFDDAINGIQRQNNNILKRHLGGDTYLYFKPSAGQFVALGKVSRIQPFIHKFLLSK